MKYLLLSSLLISSTALTNIYAAEYEGKSGPTLEVLFPTGQTMLNEEANAPLDKLASYLKENPEAKFTIEGHADSSGPDSLNKKISEKRADAVENYLVSKGGISADRISTAGYGEELPVDDNTTDDGRSKNRRVIGIVTL
jgi:outer membrane protein OmpA-like peptidoglycan-associated protein